MDRSAECACGAVTARCLGEPIRVSVCHCLNCQRRSGSAFAAQARFQKDQVTISGTTRIFQKTGDEGTRASFQFCPDCGATIAYTVDTQPDIIAVPIGAFAAPTAFPVLAYSVYETRKHPWVTITGEGIEHYD